MSQEFPGVDQVPGGFRLRSGEPYGFPRNLLAILGMGSPMVELGPEGVRVDGEAQPWSAFNTVYLSGGPELPEVIELVGDEPVTVLRTEAVPDGPRWTPAELRDFAARIASLAQLPLYDELASDQAWIDAANDAFFAMIQKNAVQYPMLHGRQSEAPTAAELDRLEIRLEPDWRYRAHPLVVTVDATRVRNGSRSLLLRDIDACRVSYRRRIVRSAEKGIRIKLNSKVISGPPEFYQVHEATLWALCGVARQVIGRVVVGGEDGVSAAEVNWTAARVLAAAAAAKTRPHGSEDDVPRALRELRDPD